MAWAQRKGDGWYCEFRYQGKRHYFTIGEVSEMEARATVAKVDYLLMRLKQHLLDIPAGCDIVTFLKYDGKPPAVPEPVNPPYTLAKLRDDYVQLHAKVLDPRTVADMTGHWKHLVRLLKEATPTANLTFATLQDYVMHRVQEGVQAATAQKEIVTLRTCWNWGQRMSLVTGPFPNRGLRFPKGRERPPFMTVAEIERRIAAGDTDDLWESVFLTLPEIQALLECVKERAAHPWIYPMFCVAAHTGARRSELLRLRVADVDLQSATALIREKKRRRGVKESTRRVPLSPFLKQVLKDWLDVHPGGPFLFCHSGTVPRSRKRSRTTGHKGEKTRPTTKKGRMASVSERAAPPQSALSRTEASDHLTAHWREPSGKN